MAAPSYTTDLQTFNDFETSLTYGEFAGLTAGRTQALDTDYPIQGSQHVSAILSAAGLGSTAVDYGSNITWTSGWNFFMWAIFTAPGAIDSIANGGMQLIIGADLSNHRQYYVGGNDVGRYPYGGWDNYVADPEVTADATTGSPGTNYRWVGVGNKTISAVAKGSPQGLDCIRYGRGELRINGGQTGNYATFAGIAAANDALAARWGLFSKIEGGYKWKGLMNLGYGSLVDFQDANVNIVVDGVLKVQPTFNKIELRTASSNLSWDTVNISALGTVSRGDFEVITNVTCTKLNCTFTDMGTFIYQSNSTITGTTYRRCGQVTQGSATMSGGQCINCRDAVSILSNNPSGITDWNFVSDGSNHAIQATTAGDYNWNSTTTGYASSDGSTGNETFYNNSGGHINLTKVGGTTPSIRNGSGATTTLIIPSVTLTISAPVSLVGAEIRIYDLDGTLPSLGTELAGVESCTTSTYDFSNTAGNVIWIQIMKTGYEEFGQSVTMPSANGGFYALLKFDVNA